MRKISLLNIVFLIISFVSKSQDIITKTNGEIINANVQEFKDGKFTLIMTDSSILIIPSANVKSIIFRKDIDNGAKAHNENLLEDSKNIAMDSECESKKIGNVKLINKSGNDTEIRINDKDGNQLSFFQITASTDPTILYNYPEGPYSFSWKKSYGNYITGTFYIQKCKTAEVIIGKK